MTRSNLATPSYLFTVLHTVLTHACHSQKPADLAGGRARDGTHPNQMGGPVTDNVGVLYAQPRSDAIGPDIVLRPQAAGPFMRVPNTHWLHDAFVFPLLFPNGKCTPGWHPRLFLPAGMQLLTYIIQYS